MQIKRDINRAPGAEDLVDARLTLARTSSRDAWQLTNHGASWTPNLDTTRDALRDS